eukprot:jgi/Astpho2/7758/Aster-07597
MSTQEGASRQDPCADSQQPETEFRVLSTSCGSSHTLALISEQRADLVVSWGRGEDGQLGHGDAEDRAKPQEVQALRNKGISSVHCGAEYSVAVCRREKQVYSWGWGDFGRLGHGDCSDVFLPQPIKAISGIEIVEVACGDTHTVAISAEGRLYSFGRNQNGQLGLGTSHDALSPSLIEALKGSVVDFAVQDQRVISVACGAEHSVASVESGEVYAWGWGRYGNLGDGDRSDRQGHTDFCCMSKYLPSKVEGIQGQKMHIVSCGWRHSACVNVQGEVYTFGWSKYGQLGHGDFEDHLTPKKIEALDGKQITMMGGGWRHAVAADDQGRMYAWGWNKFGQLGLGRTVEYVNAPRQIATLQNDRVKELSCGWRHTVCLTEAGLYYAWGRGVNGQLGHGDNADMWVPRLVKPLSIGTVSLASLAESSIPQSSYVSPADRYAVVPDQNPANQRNGDMGMVPEISIRSTHLLESKRAKITQQ